MEVVALLLFVGCLWVLAAIGLFCWNLLTEHPQHADRLALLPIEDNWQDTQKDQSAPSGARANRGSVDALPSGKSQQS